MRFGRYGTDREEEPNAKTPKPSRLSWPYRKLAAAARWLLITPTYEPDTLEKIAEECDDLTAGQMIMPEDEIKELVRRYGTPVMDLDMIQEGGDRRKYIEQKKALKKIANSARKGKTSLETLEANLDYLCEYHDHWTDFDVDIEDIFKVDTPDADDESLYRTPARESYAHTVVERFAKKHGLSYGTNPAITSGTRKDISDALVIGVGALLVMGGGYWIKLENDQTIISEGRVTSVEYSDDYRWYGCRALIETENEGSYEIKLHLNRESCETLTKAPNVTLSMKKGSNKATILRSRRQDD